MGVVQISDGIAVLEEARTIVTRRSEPHQAQLGKVESINAAGLGQVKIMGWGVDNHLPAARERLVADNNIVPSLLGTRRDITLGGGLMAYRERFEQKDGKQVRLIDEVSIPTDAQDFFDQVDIDQYLLTAAKNYMMHATVFSEFRRNKGGRIIDLKALECRHVRAEEMDSKGVIKNWYWSGQWGHQKDNKRKNKQLVTRIPSYNRLGAKQKKFLLRTGDDLLSIDEYYFTPYWWGSEEWIRLANCIPAFHQANLDHGYSIRYHIEIPKGYFAGSPAASQSPELMKKTEEAETAAKKDFLDHMNNFLAGVQKAGRTVVTDYEINKAVGKDFPGIKITPLKIDLQDEALLKLFEKSNEANISAQGVHPTLANIQTQGKLSSGSEIRNAFLMYVAIKTPLPRKTLLQPLRLLKREFNWDPLIRYGFRDMEITRLDEDKSGMREKENTSQE